MAEKEQTKLAVSPGVPLYRISAEVERIESILEENGGELTPELEALFDASTEALAVKLDHCLMALKGRESLVEALSAEIGRLNDWMRVEKQKMDWLKSYLLNNMDRAKVEKSEGVHGRLTVLKGRERVEIVDETKVPDEFINRDWVETIDKQAIKAAIKAGKKVPAGVEIKRGPKSLKVK